MCVYVSHCNGGLVGWTVAGVVVYWRRAPLWLGVGAALEGLVVDLVLLVGDFFTEPANQTEGSVALTSTSASLV